MKQAQRKSFDWYKMQQRFSIRKYHFGAASVLLGTALVLGAGAKAQTVQANEHYAEVTNSVSVDKIAETTKPAEVSTAKKETTYAAPTVVHPVEVTPAKSEAVKATVEKVEEPKVEKEEVSHQSAIDKSKLLTALSRAKKLEAKLYTEASAANLKASIQAGQSLLGKADATEAELSAAESSIQSSVIGLELRSNSDKGTVSEIPVAKKADAVEAKEEAKPAATTTDRSVLDSAVLPTSRAAIVEAFSAPKTTNEILKPGLSLSDARQNPAIRKEDLEKGHSGFRAASNPANPIVSGSGNTVAFADISQAGRSYSFRGYGNARGGHSIHYDVTTVRQGNRLNFTIQYSGPGEFVNNNFILDKGDGFGNPSNATIITPRLREQSKPISQGANFVSHSGYTMTSATETSMQQTIRFSLPINNPNGDLSVRLKPVTFNVDQGGGGAATSNDPYSNSNYYYRANPLYLDANPNGGSSNKSVTEDIDFQTVYLPTSKLPEGQTRLVREGEKGQRQITYKVHRFGNETILGLPISNSVTKEAKPRILQIGVAKELIDTVKPRVDQNKVGDTNNLTFYLDNDGNGVYTEGVDELVQKIAIKDGAQGTKGEKGDRGERGLTGAQGAKGEKGDRGERGLTGAQGTKGEKGDRGERGLTGAQGAKGEKGDRGERGLTGAQGAKGEKGDRGEHGLTGAQGQAGRDGVTPTVTVKDNKDDGTHTITINDGRGNVTSTVVRDGFDGASPLVATQRNEADKTTTVIFYYDQNDNNEFDAGDTKLKEVVITDGAKGEKGDRGERGLTGAQGAKGEKGDRGERGLTGAQGAKGEKGDQGERGLTGAQGQAGRDGVTPTVTVKDNKDDGTHTIIINDGRGNVTNTIVRDGLDGESPLVATQRNEADKTTTVIFYYDKNGNNELDASDKKLKEVVIADGVKGERGDRGETGAAGRDGKTPKITTARGADGRSTDITFTIPGEEPVTVNVKDGKDGRTPTIDLNALAEAAVRLNNQRSGRVRRALADAPSTAPQPVEGTRITAYYDNNGNGKYDPGVDELIGTSDILNGTNGRNGADGASGTDGRNGAELLSGPKAPTANDGKDGDTYIDATTGDVYKKEGRNWNQIGNIRGPQGLPGPKGDKGENGRDGFTPEVTVIDNHDGTHTITITQPEGRPALTTTVKNGENGQTPKVKAERDEAKKQTTLTFYIDKDGDGNYTEGTDTLVQTSIVKDGQDGAAGQAGRDGKEVLNGKVDPTPRDGKDGDSFVNTATGDVFVKKNNTWEQAGNIKGPKGDKGENGRDGFTPEVTVTDNHDGTHTITITQPEGRPAVTTIVKNGVDGQTPKVKAVRDEAKKQTTLTFYIDKDGDGNYTEGTDTLVQTSIVKDGQDGAAGQAGRDGKEVLNGTVDPTPRDGKDGDSFVNTVTGDVFVKKNNAWEPAGNIKGPKGDKGENGRDGFTPEVTVTDNHDGTHTITITQPEGRPALTTTVKNGENGQTPKVKAERDEAKKQTTLTFYIDKDGDGNYTEGTDTLVQTSIVKDGQDGAAGQAGRDGKEVLNGKVDPQPRDGKDGDSFVNTATGDVFVKKNNTWETSKVLKVTRGKTVVMASHQK
ncbi:G5 domain-containing protein [Streptococcus mitis]|uniref:YSIRK-type signal peptide-containing protein n=1 Tax=Streptococcus mitis TaxID=28037 RepID=A0A6I1TWG2_STRMT|nr:G5 domain-containing protein [Streptococcus mitis]MQQ30277.1 YSIRK-type signal peptide-containing protein [Streptococcus mitis]